MRTEKGKGVGEGGGRAEKEWTCGWRAEKGRKSENKRIRET